MGGGIYKDKYTPVFRAGASPVGALGQGFSSGGAQILCTLNASSKMSMMFAHAL